MRSNRLLIAVMVAAAAVAPLRAAEETVADYASSGASANPSNPSMIGQAAEAVVGRVFGVEGDASQIQYHVIEVTRHTPMASATRSLLLPGWGQYFNKQKAKGSIFFLTTLGSIVASSHLYGKARHAYDDYLERGEKDGSKYDDYQRYRNGAVMLGGVAAVVWIVSIFDAYHNAYKPLYSKIPTVDVALLEDGGAQVRFRKDF
jgi:hypothetical protein